MTTKDYNKLKDKILIVALKKLPQKFTEYSWIETVKSVEREIGQEIRTPGGVHFLSFGRYKRYLDRFGRDGKYYLKGE